MAEEEYQPRQVASGNYIAQALGDGAKAVVNVFRGGIDKERQFRNRNNMLQLVWDDWVKGVLKQSLYNEVLIELGMETQPDSVEHPWDMVIQMPDREPEAVASGTTMLELFDQANGSLLILGEPGSGKTTMLLELCRLLIEQAREGASQQIPVVFNLSSFAPKQAFADWLLSELRDKYSVPNKIGRPWIENDVLLLLLDGFDEVDKQNRVTCLQSINAFRTEHSIPLAVCSRKREYEALSTKFSFHQAVLIQPLTNLQAYEYMETAGPDFTRIYGVVQQDPELQSFVRTPLILSILILAYQDVSEGDLRALLAAGDYRKHLFSTYISKMFKHRSPEEPFSPGQTQAWLSWLARSMMEQRQILFFIEDIQPSWLPSLNRKRGLTYRLLFGTKSRLIVGLITGLIVLLFLGPLSGLIYGVSIGRIAGPKDIKPTDKLTWFRRRARNRLIIGLTIGLITGLIVGFLYGVMFRLPIIGLIAGLLFGTSSGLLVLLISFLRSESIKERSSPGDGIVTSQKSFLIAVLIYGLISGLIIWLVNTPFYMTEFGDINGLIAGLFFGTVGGLFIGLGIALNYGVGFLVRHYISRWLLYRSGNTPWKLIDFLDYCTERIFLRRVGGGYIFIHRMLMEHFADMEFDTE